MSALLPNAYQQFIDANGAPIAAGSVWFYIPGTDTLTDTWQDPAQTILNSNPVILDAAGRAQIWGTGQYRQVLFDSAGNQLWDGVTSDGSSSPAQLTAAGADQLATLRTQVALLQQAVTRLQTQLVMATAAIT